MEIVKKDHEGRQKGDWVKFYRGGQIVIGEIHAIEKCLGGRINLLTSLGSIEDDAVIETRYVPVAD